MAQWGRRRWRWRLETWKPEPPDLATSPDPPSCQGAPFSSSSGGGRDLRGAWASSLDILSRLQPWPWDQGPWISAGRQPNSCIAAPARRPV